MCWGLEGDDIFIVGTLKQPEEVLESECVGDFLTFSSIVVVVAVVGATGNGDNVSSQIASILARLWNDDALSNDDPSTVIVWELCAVPMN